MHFINILLLVSLSLTTWAQTEKIKSLTYKESITAVAIDRSGDVYLTFDNGQIHKLDHNGTFQNKLTTTPTLFEPHDGVRMFAYNRAGNNYTYLSPSLTPIASFQIDSSYAIEPWLVCSSGESNFWIIDSADKSLKKINTKSSQVEIETKLDTLTISDISFMREYQGFLFILYKQSDILIYNSIGKFLKAIKGKERHYFNFIGEELYFLENNKLKFFDLFSTETREINLPQPCTFVLITDERLLLIKDKTIDFLKMNQQ
jgi:hypothetical protein